MNIGFSPWFAPPEREAHYNHKQQAAIPSLGTYYNGLRVPALLLTLLYRIDPKTHKLTEDIFLHFQLDGPSDAQVNFPHSMASTMYDHRGGCTFDVSMDVLFGQGNTLSRTVKGGGNIGLEGAIVKGGVEGSYEAGKQYSDTQTILHGRINGTFDSKAPHHRLHVGGYMTGDATRNRSR